MGETWQVPEMGCAEATCYRSGSENKYLVAYQTLVLKDTYSIYDILENYNIRLIYLYYKILPLLSYRCGLVSAEPGCKIVSDSSLPYPSCCPTIYCESPILNYDYVDYEPFDLQSINITSDDLNEIEDWR